MQIGCGLGRGNSWSAFNLDNGMQSGVTGSPQREEKEEKKYDFFKTQVKLRNFSLNGGPEPLEPSPSYVPDLDLQNFSI